MFFINKITSNSTVDFAAEELKKYLRIDDARWRRCENQL